MVKNTIKNFQAIFHFFFLATLRFRKKLHEKKVASNENLSPSLDESDRIEVSSPQPNIDELIERVEKSIEFHSTDEMPEFDNFESIPDASNANQTAIGIANATDIDGSKIEEVPKNTHNNEAESASNMNGCDNSNPNCVSIDCTEPLLEPKITDLSSKAINSATIEISEVESMNMLNICMNSSNELRQKFNKQQINCQTNKLIGAPKPIIEVLSDSNCNELSLDDFTEVVNNEKISEKNEQSENMEIFNEFKVDSSKSTDNEETVEEITNSPNQINHTLNAIDSNDTSTESNRMAKSSAITFYCENLDDLKGMDSDSDQSVEEI